MRHACFPHIVIVGFCIPSPLNITTRNPQINKSSIKLIMAIIFKKNL
ncbi:hypothetical Protein YC6258_01693 [Gynuella sunshinyii YC6258]|uniref:Uncharacterized protein n=1 Tax=Gynuella sunshinyii YC6258 TaxID=1445510 RepID=A0A0C5VGP8_9GAMM|nr:hypothetical Protein YC6258_01693 [Gynuella sunshinyii YC6258]